MKKKIIIIYSIAAVLLAVAISGTMTVRAVEMTGKPGTIPAGYTINGIPVGGMNESEASEAAKKLIDRIQNTNLVVNVAGDMNVVSFGAISETNDPADFIDTAAETGTEGNIIERYKEIKDAEESPKNLELAPLFDEEKVERFVKSLYKKYKVNAENATLTRENGQFIIGPGKEGQKIYYGKSLEAVTETLDNFEVPEGETSWQDPVCELTLSPIEPEYDENDMALVTDKLGTYSTQYGTVRDGRAKNVENGCRLINGSVVMPGEELDADAKMRPYTEENGYGTGGAYVNGQVVDNVGGGICQVSTTLYNAVLYSELEVVERFNHSMTVTYVPLSRDAAIAGDWKNFIFKNNTEYPVYVEGVASNGTITFNIYGHETRDTAHRTLEFEPKVLKTIKPEEDIVTIDKTKPADYEQVTQGAYTGYEVQLIKKVKIDGKVTEESVVNTSNYKAVGRYVTKGNPKIKPKDENASTSAVKSDKDKKTETEKNNKKNTNTKTNTKSDTKKDKGADS